jgi:hypothetical protein
VAARLTLSSKLEMQACVPTLNGSARQLPPAMERQIAIDLARRKGCYGIDAPYLLLIPTALIVINILNAVAGRVV